MPDERASTSGKTAERLRRAGSPVALALLAGVAAASYARTKPFRSDVDWRGHTYQVMQHIEQTHTALLAADAMRRTYRLSHERSDLEQMDSRLETASRELAMVEEHTQDNPRQQERIRALRPIVAGESVMAADAEVLRRGETCTFEQVASVGDRSWTFHSTKGPLRGPDGEVRGIIAVSRDISDRKKLQERLEKQNFERGDIIERLERRSAELAALAEMARLLRSADAPVEVYELVAHFATRLFGGGGLGVIEPTRSRVDPVAATRRATRSSSASRSSS